jgi:hypothetical protein
MTLTCEQLPLSDYVISALLDDLLAALKKVHEAEPCKEATLLTDCALGYQYYKSTS